MHKPPFMRPLPLALAALACLAFSLPPALRAAPGKSAPPSDAELIPTQGWGIVAFGFNELFKLRLEEISASVPDRFFKGTVAFVLTRMDADGHFLLLKCSAVSAACTAQK